MRFLLSASTALILGAISCTGNLVETASAPPGAGAFGIEEGSNSHLSLEEMMSSRGTTQRDVNSDIMTHTPSPDDLAEKMKMYLNNKEQNTNDRDLQNLDGVLYAASFVTVTQNCGGFTPLMSFGCTGDGILSIIDVTSDTGFSPACAEHPVLGSSYALCAVGYDTDLVGGPVTNVRVGFACDGFSDSQRIGEALHDSHAPVCLTDFGDNFAANSVQLAYYNSFQEGFDFDGVCLLGTTEVSDSGVPFCFSGGACSIGSTCSTTVPAVHVIQSTPLVSGAIFVPPPDGNSPTPPAPTPTPPPPTPFPTNRPPMSSPTPFPTDRPPTPFPTNSPPVAGPTPFPTDRPPTPFPTGSAPSPVQQADNAPTPTFGGNSNPGAPTFPTTTFGGGPPSGSGDTLTGFTTLLVVGATTLFALVLTGDL